MKRIVMGWKLTHYPQDNGRPRINGASSLRLFRSDSLVHLLRDVTVYRISQIIDFVFSIIVLPCFQANVRSC
jgi:hypothetical protein